MARSTFATLEEALPQDPPPALITASQPKSKPVLVPADSLPSVDSQPAMTIPFNSFAPDEAGADLMVEI